MKQPLKPIHLTALVSLLIEMYIDININIRMVLGVGRIHNHM